MRGATPGLEALVSADEPSGEEHHEQNTRPARSAEGARDIMRLWVGEGGEGAKYWQQALLETQKPGARAAHPFSGGACKLALLPTPVGREGCP